MRFRVVFVLLLILAMAFGLPRRPSQASSRKSSVTKKPYQIISTKCQEGYVRIDGKCLPIFVQKNDTPT
ncbi:hypothetical protein Zmor_010209 [Zophobas morio]|uniref:Uncharacterized protein n=1 Tax=Zophobas morio TaxID=2755281 RepID=A0AA38INW5_9CUCU|nr:hypothetical protein Zmor_010209 [Zophobas morio]